jgi:aminoglycoside 2'-N-acetyltransferase I
VPLAYDRTVRMEMATSDRLPAGVRRDLRALLDAAWAAKLGEFNDQDWQNALGFHVLLLDGDEVVSHASVVERALESGGRVVRTGYVEAVVTRPELQRRGYATRVMAAVHDHIDAGFELGALDAAVPEWYARLGWLRWEGPTAVRTVQGVIRTPEEDGRVFVRLTPTTPELDRSAQLACEWRPGDVW